MVSAVHFTFSKFLIFVTVILNIFEGETSLIYKLEICLEKGKGHLFSSNEGALGMKTTMALRMSKKQ